MKPEPRSPFPPEHSKTTPNIDTYMYTLATVAVSGYGDWKRFLTTSGMYAEFTQVKRGPSGMLMVGFCIKSLVIAVPRWLVMSILCHNGRAKTVYDAPFDASTFYISFAHT